MILTRLAADSADSLPQHQSQRFVDPRLEHCDASDEQLIEAALAEINVRIVRASRSLVLYPGHRELQTSFAKLVNRRDDLEQRLSKLLSEARNG